MSAIYSATEDFAVKLVLVALLALLLFMQFRLWSGAGSLAEISRLEAEIDTQQRENAVLLERNQSLREEVRDLKTGQDAIEERARNELGLIREGETFYLILEEEASSAAH